MIAPKIAHINVEGYSLHLRPGVDAQMGFGQQHSCRDPRWAKPGWRKCMKQVRNRLQTRRLNGHNATVAQSLGVG